jgi:mannose-1-phosphate guanylyltransferase
MTHEGEGTIMSWEVEDPSRFGVIVHSNKIIEKFVEKPKEPIGFSINAGHYIFEPSIVDRVCRFNPDPSSAISIEREIFPQMASERQLYVHPLEGIWMDIGTPAAFIDCINLFLTNPNKVLVAENAVVGQNCKIGPTVVIGPNCTIGNGCRIENSVILAGAQIGDNSVIVGSIVGWSSQIGKDVQILELAVLGEKVVVKDGLVLRGVLAAPEYAIVGEVSPKAKCGDWTEWEQKQRSGL